MSTALNPVMVPDGLEDFMWDAIAGDDYEIHLQYLIKRYIKYDDERNVLEGGAGLGIITRLLASRADFVLACEPNVELAKCAQRNAPNAQIATVALGNRPVDTGEAFGVEDTTGGHWDLDDIDEMVEGYDIDTIVLDIEGAEAEVLRGINLEPLSLVIVEVHPRLCDFDPAHYRLTDGYGFKFDCSVTSRDTIIHRAYVK